MNKPVALAIKQLREGFISAINQSQLPASVMEPIIHSIYVQVAQAAEQETQKAEQDYFNALQEESMNNNSIENEESVT